MNTNGLDFWGVSWVLRWRLQFISYFIRGSVILMWLIPFMFEDVLSILIKCFVSSRCAWKSLSICISFTLLFCLANFVKWWLLFYWMGFGVMDIEVSQGSSFFQKFCRVLDFHMDCNFAFTGAVCEQCSNDIFCFPPLKSHF